MSIVSTKNLSKSFGDLDVFAGLSLSVPHGARIAIVGPNGVGKTTLLKVMAGKEPPSSGTLSHSRDLTVGYLPQETVTASGNTLWEECLVPFESLQGIQDELARLESEMTDPGKAEQHLEEYGTLQARFEEAGGYTYETRIRQVLCGLGFSEAEYGMQLTSLSGGQRTRALLARLLLERPRLLILDEPTNHLDTYAVEWLENHIRDWDGAVMVVSHDRYLLDKVCSNTWEMSPGGIETYRGNYSHYLRQRQERWELRSKEFEAEKGRLEQEMDYIRRNIDAANVAQARGRLKRLSRQIQSIEQIGLEAMRGKSWLRISQEVDITTSVMTADEAHRRIRALKNPVRRPKELRFKLRAAQRGGNIVLRTRGLTIGYPGNKLFEVPDIELTRLECAALIGPNGSGKTTFLKTILARQAPLEGKVELGASLDIGYFAQAHEGLKSGNTLIQEIESVAPHMLLPEIRSYLARYLFPGEDVFKKVSVLSGGERGRLSLAKLALGDANVLLLDEPTNHLDIPSQEVLQNVLADFEGTVILVSHDRYLIDALATQMWEIGKAEAILRVYRGTYSEYRNHREAVKAADATECREEKGKAFREGRAAKNREIAKERRRKARLAEVDAAIAALEEKLEILGRQLRNPPSDRTAVHRIGEDYLQAESELEVLIDEWEKLQP